jgi:hypothetical protein
VKAVKSHLDSGRYVYNQVPPRSRYPLMNFLFTTRVGYCQQFSGAMAMLLRMGGIPARVAAGFTTGTADTAAHTWEVSDVDAHAWVEVWFPHDGWVKFDPTPANAPARGGALGPSEERPIPHAQPSAGLHPHAAQSHTVPRPPTGGRGGHSAGGSGDRSDPWSAIAIGLGAALLAAMVAVGWRGWRRQGETIDPVAELHRALTRTGRSPRPGLTLAQLERDLRHSPEAAAYVRALRLARYGAAPQGSTAAGRRALRRRLTAGLGISGRLRGLWALPPRPRAVHWPSRSGRG